MADHFSLLQNFYYRLGCLDGGQKVVDATREAHPDDQDLQLKLDRVQTGIDEERYEISEALVSIPLSN